MTSGRFIGVHEPSITQYVLTGECIVGPCGSSLRASQNLSSDAATPDGDRPMTDAERQRNRRERLRQEHDEQRKRKEAGAQYLRAAKQAWVDDHPDHTAADFDHWGSCSATPTQERHWHDWEAAFSAKYWKGEPAAKAKPMSRELAEARREIERLRQRIHDLEAVLAHERAAKQTHT